MKLLHEIERRKSPSGKWTYRYGLFFCNYCEQSVERLFYSGKSQRSCGCVTDDLNTKHGHYVNGVASPIAAVWHGMKDRCFNLKNKRYARYGGRGISICSAWLGDPEAFFSWALKNGWEPGLQIDRKKNDLGYSPNNCHFVTSAANGRNRRSTRLSMVVAREIRSVFAAGNTSKWDLARSYGVGWGTIADVIRNRTWIDKEASNV